MRFQLHTHRRAFRLAARDIEAPLVQRTFDFAIDDETIGEMRAFMRTPAIRREETAVNAIYRVARALMIEANHVFFVNVMGRAGDDPLQAAGFGGHGSLRFI